MRILLFTLLFLHVDAGLFDVLGKVIASFLSPASSTHPKLVLSSLEWSSCGSAADLAVLTRLDIEPDPLTLPGNVTVGLDVLLRDHIDSPVKVDLNVRKREGLIWITVPCLGNVGSCTYELCHLLMKLDHCPQALEERAIPCACPLKAGDYSLPEATFDFGSIHVPTLFLNGDYKVQAKVSNLGQQLLCLDISFNAKKE